VNTSPARLLLTAEHAVQIGARILRQGRSHIRALIDKGDRDFATDVDLQIEAEIKASLAEAAPDIPFLGDEEGGEEATDQARWVLDPIDGTIYFARDSPLCSISLSIAGQPVLGIVNTPFPASGSSPVKAPGHRRRRTSAVRPGRALRSRLARFGACRADRRWREPGANRARPSGVRGARPAGALATRCSPPPASASRMG
jgi:3'-phosphoadenosine 5'-phosphosulfate (PAPS) 3'-phosphatase